jgi:hypothetical protein
LDSRAEAGPYRPLDIRHADRPQGSIPTRDLGSLIGETFGVYGRSFWPFVSIAFLGQVPAVVAILTPELLSAALSLIGTFTSLLAGLALIHAVMQQYTGSRQVDVGECFSRALNRFIIALAAIIIFILVLIGSTILMIILVGIPILFYMLVIWFFHQQAIIVEHRGPIEALGRSRELVKGTWWRVFGIGTVFVLLLLALSLPGVIVGLVFGIFNDALGSLVITLTNLLVLPLLSVSATVVYIDLRVRKEGYDLETMAAELGPVPSGFSI